MQASKYTASRPTLAEGETKACEYTDNKGAPYVAVDDAATETTLAALNAKLQGDSTNVFSTALEDSRPLKGSAGYLRHFDCRVDSTLAAGTYYVQLLIASSLPANGAVTHLRAPFKVIHVAGVDDFISWTPPGKGAKFATGCVAALSSTEYTLTVGGDYLSLSALTD